MLTESLFLGIAGGIGGLMLSFAGLRAVVALSPGSLPRVAELGIDTRIFAFAIVVSVLTGILFGMAPALQFSRPNLDRTLRDDDRGNSGGKMHQRLRGGLVVAEISIALVLLFGAGLLTKSFRQLAEVDLGVETGGVLTYEVHLPSARYPGARDRIAFYDRYFERVQTIAGVESVGATSYLPGEGRYHSWSMGRADLDLEDDESWTGTDVRVVDGDYLQLMGIELIRGRLFDGSDTFEAFENDRGAVLLNETLAERAFPDRDPLGAEVTFGGDDFLVVGIVSDTAHDPLGTTSPKVYATHDQFADDRNWAMIQTIRTSVGPLSIIGQLRDELRQVDSQLVLYKVRTMDDIVARGISPQRFSMALMTSFAAIALASGRGRYLRRPVVHRRPAHPRDRHSYGARRRPLDGARDDHAPRPGDHRTRRDSRHRRRPGDRRLAVLDAFRGAAARSCRARGRSPGARGCGDDRRLPAGVTGDVG